jgi:tryptophan-rich sensory protein
MEIVRKTVENRLPIFLLGIVGIGLCIYGALQMRKRKKTGFSVYVLGELLPVVSTVIFIGTGSFGGLTIIGSLLIPVIFIILYSTQLKHLS